MHHFKLHDPHFLPHCGCEVEFLLKPGGGIILFGENGLGKTTLLHRLWSESSSPKVYVEQKALDPFYDWTLTEVKKNLLKQGCEKLEYYWKAFGLEQREDRRLSQLSGGEGQQLKLVCALALEAEVYFLDEPFQFLDPDKRRILTELLEEKRRKHAALLIVEHNSGLIGKDWEMMPLKVINGVIMKDLTWST